MTAIWPLAPENIALESLFHAIGTSSLSRRVSCPSVKRDPTVANNIAWITLLAQRGIAGLKCNIHVTSMECSTSVED